jgi:hypothetical protein
MVSAGSSSSTQADALPAADFIVAMPVFNQVRTIGGVVRAGAAVLDRGFDGLHGQLLVVDGGSRDNTAAAARAAAGDVGDRVRVMDLPGHATEVIQLPFHGMPGRARALHALFDATRQTSARAIVVIDAAEAAITGDWIVRLLRPALDAGIDFVAPAYRRHPFDGALVKSIVAPMFRACFGLVVRHPTAPEFACSRRFVEQTVAPGAWTVDAGDAGIDLWLAVTAASNGFQVCEAPLGARTRAAREDAPDLSTTIAQVVGALFGEVERRASTWHRTRGSRPVATCGVDAGERPDPPAVDPARLIDSFRLGHRELAAVWSEILPPATILELRRLAAMPESAFQLNDRLWARIVYDFALGYRLRVIAREHLLGALTPLYLAWLASFVLTARRSSASADEIDALAGRLGDAFESEKPYLISRWRWPERIPPSRF